ncbi:MAG: PEP-CTERM sorting domain-containing protein [Pirellulales bacterium]|nr:PEP-CTERM sorting domain-containing protein [Pirellulales bacterium]
MITRRWIVGIGAALLGLAAVATEGQAAPQKIFAISQQQPAGLPEVAGNPSDTILLYDVTAVGTPGATNVFNNQPLFSVWLGYEIFEGEVGDVAGGMPRGNREDTSAITFNSANGTIYAVAFDSGSPGVPDPVGDNQGDNDLYRIDYQELLNDFVTNSRPAGTIYAPPTQRISIVNEQFLADISSPLYDGTVDGIAHNVPHPGALTSTVYMPNAIQKIGEVGRAQTAFSFFDTEISFVDPATLVLMDTATRPEPGNPAGDFQIRALERVSTAPGAAVIDPDGPDNLTGPPGNAGADDDQQGGRNGNSVQSWESAIMGRLQMDSVDDSEPGGWALVRRDGKIGLWVADNDAANSGDETSYFELDFSGATPTATKKTLPTSAVGSVSFRVDENPTVDATTNNGEIDFLAVDKNGNLVVVESGFADTIPASMTPPTGAGGLTAQQPRVLTADIESYSNAAGVVPEGFTASGGTTTFDSTSPWSVSASMSPTASDDTQVLNTTKVAYDKGTGYIYVIEQDADFVEDIYVFDPVTGQMVYEELNAFNPGLFNTGTQIVFTRGDVSGDGVVNQNDVTTLQAGITDPTLGGTVSAAVGAEWYDLTADGLLTAADMTALIAIIGAAPIAGDFDGDGTVDGDDLAQWRGDFGGPGSDADGDGDSDGNDFLIWQRNLGQSSATPSAAAVPEPGALALLAVGALGLAAAGRRRK